MSESPLPAHDRNAAAPRRLSLRFKLPLTVIGLLSVALLVLTYTSIRYAQQALTSTIEDELLEQATTKAENIRSNLLVSKTFALELAAFAETDQLEEANLIATIQRSLLRNEDIFGVVVAFEPNQFKPGVYYYAPHFSRQPNGAMSFTNLGAPKYDYFIKEWYTLPKESRTVALSAPYFDAGGGNIWMVSWGAPFFDRRGAFKGVAAANIAFSQTQEAVNHIQVGKEGYAFLIDQTGIILGVGDNGGDYQVMSDSMALVAFAEKAERWIELIANMRAGKTGFIEVTDPRGKPMLVAYAPVGLDTGWSLALAYPVAEVSARTSQIGNTLIGYSAVVILLFSLLSFVFSRSLTEPLRKLREFAGLVSSGSLTGSERQVIQPIQIGTHDELEDLGVAFNQMSETLQASFATLEENVASRTRDLARLANELRTIAEVNRELAVIRDQSALLNVSANLIRERLGFYHVGIFLVDDRGEYAVLRGASSVAAEQMLSANYKLKVGETGLVGAVTRTGQAYIAQDVNLDEIHHQNLLLPETRSEIALPLRSYNVTTGVIDIQANLPDAFDNRDLQTLQVLADQLAAAIENAQLVQRLEGTLAEISRSNQIQARQVWRDTIGNRGDFAYEYDGLQIHPVPKDLPAGLLARLEEGNVIEWSAPGTSTQPSKDTLLVPLTILGQVIGVVGLEKDNAARAWSREDVAIAQAAANRAALTLENARLLEDSNRRAAKESAIFAATSRIGTALSVENILQITVEELDKVLKGAEITIQITGNPPERK